ncbi:MAG: DUF6036 family nucleotidyltransferase [Coriobacteriia bacterium]|nr:DUF6036 family nucleotidyltransferase [Coriobacteriia bacterium]
MTAVSGGDGLNCGALESRLREFDRAVVLLYPGRSFRLIVVGGGALVLLGCLTRATADLDALEVPATLIDLAARYDISHRVAAYLDHFALNLEDRLVQLGIGTTAVICYAASLEDVVAAKLCSGRDTDEADVRRPEVLAQLDWARLDVVATEVEGSLMSEQRRSQFLYNLRRFTEEYRP